MPRLTAKSPWRFFLLAVLLAAALAPACLRVFSVAHAARWAGACLPSQGAQAESVRLGWQAHQQAPAGHHAGGCEVCAVCAGLGDMPWAAATAAVPSFAPLAHRVALGGVRGGASGAEGDAPLARGPPRT